MMARKKSQDPSISSEERKNNMGALPHMAVLAGETPILVATPWVLVPKGVQVHRPPGKGHRASHDRPPANGPMEKKTHPADRSCPVTGHQACPVTGHQPPDGHHPPGKSARKRLPAYQSPGTGHPVSGHWN